MQRVTISGQQAPQNAFAIASVEHVRNRKTRIPSEPSVLHGRHSKHNHELKI